MPLHALAIVAGFGLLFVGAERFVGAAAATARVLGVPTLVIGLVVVGFGTSAPEMLVSATAAWNGETGLAIGNAIGSNIANIALVLGATALLRPLVVHSRVLRRELPILLAVSALAPALLLDGRLGRLDGVLLMGALAALLWGLVRLARRDAADEALVQEFDAEIDPGVPLARALLSLGVGLAILLAGARLLVWGAVAIAQALGVSDLVIGLTIVAVGTSLPELAASVAGALKGEADIAIGNVIGSNMFNLLAVLGLPGLIRPGAVPHEVLARDYPVMLALTVLLFLMAAGIRGRGRIGRWEGAALLVAFATYQAWLLRASGHG